MSDIRAAATVLLVRDGTAGLEVLMIEHHQNVGGSLVFPGGKIEASDSDPRFLERSRGLANIDEAARANYVAALRETFEEAGLLLARKMGSADIIGRAEVEPLQPLRKDIVSGDLAFIDLLESHDLELAADPFVWFAHWNTPEYVKRQLAVHFFIAEAPEAQDVKHDGWESVDSVWLRPTEGLAAAMEGRSKIAFPTRMVLRRLMKSESVHDALAEARDTLVEPMRTEVVTSESGTMGRIPARSGFEAITELMDMMSAKKPGT